MPRDLRAPALALVAWLGALAGLAWADRPLLLAGAGAGSTALGCWWIRSRRASAVTVVGWLLVGMSVGLVAAVRADVAREGPVAAWAEAGATVRGTVVITSDPVRRTGRFEDGVRLRASLRTVTVRGHSWRLRADVVVLADPSWQGVRLGERVKVRGRLAEALGGDQALLRARGDPRVVGRAGPLFAAAEDVRAGIREAVAGADDGPRALVPALVDGDDGDLPGSVQDDFRVTGLTHLLAVSGTNLTLIVGFLLVIARWSGVRARGLVVVGLLGVVGFVLLARTEPSVVRAAAMGTVALIGLGIRGRQRGPRALGVAVVVLLLFDPRLATSVGFALSASATAGILFLAPGWRDALARWLPRWVAEAIAVPTAAQLACTPLVAAISGQVSLVAVAANLAVAWAVGPATVLGLLGGLVAMVWPALGAIIAAPAGWCAAWIIAVAQTGADVPIAAVRWGTGAPALALLTGVCVAVALLLDRVLARAVTSVGCVAIAVIVVVVPLPSPGWPPAGWVMVACDVGQGDALVLNAGGGAAMLVDAGPDPDALDSCLDRLGVRRLPLVVLTHFHADHVDGLPGAVRDRAVGRIVVSPLAEPDGGVRVVETVASARGVLPEVAAPGSIGSVGPVAWQVVSPLREHPDSASPPNDASVVLVAQVRGCRILLMGDQERAAQADLRRAVTDLRVDVLKVAHHGSSKQDADLIRGVDPSVAVISVGADNDYGHPAPSTVALLREIGARVLRTDRDGDVAIVVDERGRIATESHRPLVATP